MNNFIEYVLIDINNWEETEQNIRAFIDFGIKNGLSFEVFQDDPINDPNKFIEYLHNSDYADDQIIFYDPNIDWALNGWVLEWIADEIYTRDYKSYTWKPFKWKQEDLPSIF